ncbi:hypothetical protein AGJ34_13310 [Cronobacter dublinensis subsp. dublinensis]|nr:hypothetical protein [Cronobacter dublinensis subsp. dublinensis]EGT5669456.1 hypothetical protein [Cronobacter dublinensis subsp. dublinensis]EGT5673970.1 hypothetical protein [Cronobacter dublinensis subsp. dublinensis]EGT5677388.1 hypothetical protein [Cronobacter dublinensis subsp. dublinensis]EGT5686372.1 hypothetical protein [Cronobacter dublinensis subsp. dublinensis]
MLKKNGAHCAPFFLSLSCPAFSAYSRQALLQQNGSHSAIRASLHPTAPSHARQAVARRPQAALPLP